METTTTAEIKPMEYALLSVYGGRVWHVTLAGSVQPFCGNNTRRWARRKIVSHIPFGELIDGKPICGTCDHSIGR